MKTITDFANKKEFYKYLVANKAEIIRLKKSAVKFADAFGIGELQTKASKSFNTAHKDDVASGKITRTIILNTYNWLDSHDDVHVGNTFQKSISDGTDKWHLHDHLYQLTAKVGKPLSIYEKKVAWTDLGIDKTGETTVLMMDSEIMKDWNPQIFGQYLAKEVNQHSVGMRYVDIELAINDPEEKAAFAQWNMYLDVIGNKEKAVAQGYFWPVKEAELVEGSCVLKGSNELTPTLENDEEDKKQKQSEKAVDASALFMKNVADLLMN